MALDACRKQEQAVVGAAQNAAAGAIQAERKAQASAAAAAQQRDSQRAALAAIPLPAKSQYIDVHDPAVWANPFLAVNTQSVTLRVVLSDSAPVGQRATAARRQEMVLKPGDVTKALIGLPRGAWKYGRVVAVAEAPVANKKDRPQVRRNVEELIQQLNDLGIVVNEWPTK
jgi:hypothetical protein